jgi:hypothetical protein
MASDALTLQLPPSLSERAQRAAQALQQPVKELLIQTLDATQNQCAEDMEQGSPLLSANWRPRRHDS